MTHQHWVYVLNLDPQTMLHLADHVREARVTWEQTSSLSAPYSPEEQSWDHNNLAVIHSYTHFFDHLPMLATKKKKNHKKLFRAFQTPEHSSARGWHHIALA